MGPSSEMNVARSMASTAAMAVGAMRAEAYGMIAGCPTSEPCWNAATSWRAAARSPAA